MKYVYLLLLLLGIHLSLPAQSVRKVSTIDFVAILNNNRAEATYYYENNWKVLRDMAVERGYIDSYLLLETPYSPEAPFHLMLVTTYKNQKQYKNREENFSGLIEEIGELKLLNQKDPKEFRNTLYTKEEVKILGEPNR